MSAGSSGHAARFSGVPGGYVSPWESQHLLLGTPMGALLGTS